MRTALATGIVAKPAARRSVQAKAGLKVYARMTKDRVKLNKDSKWRSDCSVAGEAPPAAKNEKPRRPGLVVVVGRMSFFFGSVFKRSL